MADIILPGIYTQEIDSGPRAVSPLQAGVIGLVGAAPKGPVDEIVSCSSFGDVERNFGPIASGNDISEKANVMFNCGASQINIVRVTNGSPAKATKTLVDTNSANALTLTAKSYGTYGNQIAVTVTASTTGGHVDVRIQDEYSNLEEFYQTKNMILGDDSYLVDAINAASEIVDATLVANSLIVASAAAYLTGGLDGTTPDATALIGSSTDQTGLKLLETDPTISILASATGTDTAVWVEMIAQAERTKDRIAVLNLANGLTAAQAVSAIQSYESQRAVVAFPSVKIYDYVTGSTKTISASFCLAGILSGLDTYKSPSNQAVNGIVGLERTLNQADMETLYQARICPISVVLGRGTRMRGGITLSSDPKWAQVCKRREMDKIQKSVKSAMGWAISQPNTAVLRDNVQTSIKDFLTQLVNNGEIGPSSTAICGSTNNTTATIAAGYLICDVLVEFLYPADKVIFRYQEKLGEG